ncbi:hypothetical protein [Gracilibacillus phocaeensis]|uniref:hypothetical protein n=1 Tax=Gracilibacillus phocaeensis TaxID=2042304 RepID=UPI00102F9D70|nr:hypothetical protein [Gracilibacillus phocaeensis]
MKRKKIGLIIAVVGILLISTTIYYFWTHNYTTQNNNIQNSHDNNVNELDLNTPFSSNDQIEDPITEIKYYTVYIEEGGDGTSFIPETLNPDFSKTDGFHVSLSFDDAGNIITHDKLIVIENYTLSEENKKQIKEIAGNNYEEAIKEIEEHLHDNT